MLGILLHLLPHIAAAVLYAGLGYYFWHTRWNDTGKPLTPLPMQPWERCAIALALSLQGFGLYQAMFSGGGLRFSFSLTISLMLWLAVLIYWLESFRSRMDGMQPMVLPLAAISAALPVVFAQTHEIVHVQAMGFKMHFLAAMLAYSLFTVSALNAVFMAFIEHQLHRKTLGRHQASLPSILSMETLLFRIIGIAFVLLTLTLISGLAFAEQIFGKAFVLDHKTSFAFASWTIFAALLFGRYNYGWRGRVALRWTLAGFLLLVLAYIG
ncbi:MAG: cytochrome c biogenesis protein CcsA, partial [Candidatus Accumulibacter sp.]|nr:cytochrome c biogenesis protein CcsA [Accumulibacter sp.]